MCVTEASLGSGLRRMGFCTAAQLSLIAVALRAVGRVGGGMAVR